jgi:Ca2+-binding EF-hand superfamily protein
MKKLFFAGAALAVLAAAPATAQPRDGRGPVVEPVSRADVEARVQERFARADANRDGFVTQDEIRAGSDARRGERMGGPGERMEQRGEGRGRLFDRLDSNRDGSISRAEFDARPAFRSGERGERQAMRGERQGMRGEPHGERFAHRGPRGGMMGGLGGRGFEAMDLDHDGRVALAEANRAALQRFDRVDANHDGTISPDERQAAREAFRERMQERQGD